MRRYDRPATRDLYTGSWWLPDQPELSVGGSLVRDKQQHTLLQSVAQLVPLHDRSREHTILGRTIDGTLITLYKAVRTSSRGHNGTGPSAATAQEFLPEVTIIGAHLEPMWPVRFSAVEFAVSHLAEWLNIPAFAATYPPGELSPTWEYIRPADIRVSLPGSVRLTITSSMRGTADPLRRLKMVHSPALRLDAKTPFTLQEWDQKYITPLRQLVTLGTEEHNELLSLSVYPDGSHLGATVLVHPRRPARGTKAVRPSDVAFGFQDIRDSPVLPIRLWLEFAREHDYLCDLYFDATYSPTIYAHLQFLSLAQAAEAYHRNCLAKSRRSKTSFDQRLLALLDRVGPALVPAIIDRSAFVRHVEDTRNYYTHYNPGDRARPIRDVESLYWLAQQLGLVLAACFYLEMDFPLDRVKRIMENSRRLYWVQAQRDAGRIEP